MTDKPADGEYTVSLPHAHWSVIGELLTNAPMPYMTSAPIIEAINKQVTPQFEKAQEEAAAAAAAAVPKPNRQARRAAQKRASLKSPAAKESGTT